MASLRKYEGSGLTAIRKVRPIMSSTARSDPLEIKYSITDNAW